MPSKVIGRAMAVHRELGCGFQEVIYQRALEIEMSESGVDFSRELGMSIFYKRNEIGTRRVDFLIEGVPSNHIILRIPVPTIKSC